MLNIAKLPLALDQAGMRKIPLHIFGALDPLSSALYFMAGAESWVRPANLPSKSCFSCATHQKDYYHE
jgi:hypothetical protein